MHNHHPRAIAIAETVIGGAIVLANNNEMKLLGIFVAWPGFPKFMVNHSWRGQRFRK